MGVLIRRLFVDTVLLTRQYWRTYEDVKTTLCYGHVLCDPVGERSALHGSPVHIRSVSRQPMVAWQQDASCCRKYAHA